nr:type II toxin-antitoxin system MqsR family toxin [Bordetella sp. LUAb4]
MRRSRRREAPRCIPTWAFVFDILDVVLALGTADFYKSMTTYDDHGVWQDVYRPATSWGRFYVKLTVIDDVLIVSFKEL